MCVMYCLYTESLKYSRSPKIVLFESQTTTALKNTKKLNCFLGKGGHFGQVFRIKPPMCITKADAELTAQVLEEAIAAVEATLSS
jgi:alanine-glyoxylate transaminase/(R)-3-amino-2-methylpropionate-pyruvate transaminase